MVGVAVLLLGRGSGPSKDLMKDDMAIALVEQGAFLTLDSIEVLEENRQDGIYTAELDLTADGKYARFYYAVDVAYHKENGGWVYEESTWTRTEYEIHSYPTQEEVNALVNTSEEIQRFSLVGYEEDTLWMDMPWNHIDVTCQNIVQGEDSVEYIGTVSFNIGKLVWADISSGPCNKGFPSIQVSGTVNCMMRYTPEEDTWKMERISPDLICRVHSFFDYKFD